MHVCLGMNINRQYQSQQRHFENQDSVSYFFYKLQKIFHVLNFFLIIRS